MRTIYFAHDTQESPEPRRHFLELAGYVVKPLKSWAELATALDEEAPSLLLIDTLLEGRNGFEAAREVSRRTKKREFPIVLCSYIYRLRPFREEALRAGAQDYLLLPMAPDEFLRRINQAIGYFVPPEREASSATA